MSKEIKSKEEIYIACMKEAGAKGMDVEETRTHPGFQATMNAMDEYAKQYHSQFTPKGSVEGAAKEYLDNHSDVEVRRMYGHHYRSFVAGANWQALSGYQGAWVKAETLPKTFDYILCLNEKTGEMKVCQKYHSITDISHKFVYDDRGTSFGFSATHWMPLPAKPGDESSPCLKYREALERIKQHCDTCELRTVDPEECFHVLSKLATEALK